MMALSCFTDGASRPTKQSVATALASSGPLWLGLIRHITTRYPPISEEWAFSSAQAGWSLRLVHKKRRILYLIPQEGAFLVGVVLGEKAVTAANSSPLPKAVLSEINGARKYAEGRGIRLRVQSPADVQSVEVLAAIKVEN
jgi:hypothetical protein